MHPRERNAGFSVNLLSRITWQVTVILATACTCFQRTAELGEAAQYVEAKRKCDRTLSKHKCDSWIAAIA